MGHAKGGCHRICGRDGKPAMLGLHDGFQRSDFDSQRGNQRQVSDYKTTRPSLINVLSSELETFRVWRYNWTDAKARLIFKKLLSGDIRSNWIEGNLTGCVGIVDDSSTFIYVVNWETFDEAYIETEFGVRTT